MRRVISWKRLLIVLGAVLVTSAAVYGVYLVQNKRHASGLRDNANRLLADAEKDPEKGDEAIKLLDQYIKLQPRDEATYRKYAEANFDRAKRDPEKHVGAAFKAGEDFLRQFPDNVAERKRLIELYVDYGRLASALQHIRILFDKGQEYREDVDLLEKAAVCERASGNVAPAVKYLDDAIQTKKAPPRVVQEMLDLLQSTKAFNDPRFTPAKYVEILVSQDPYRNDVEARVIAGRFLLLTGETPNARRHITEALAMTGSATNAEALLAAAELERFEIKSAESLTPQLKKARALLETAFALDKKNVRVGLELAKTLRDLNEHKAAVDVLRQSAEALGEKNDDLMQKLVDGLLDLDERELSAQLIDRIAKNARDREKIVKYFRGRMDVLKQDWTAARPVLEEIAPSLVRFPEYHKKAMWGLGYCYAAIQNPDKQFECFDLALKDDIHFVQALIGRADALLKLGRHKEALTDYKILVDGYGLYGFRLPFAKLEMRAALRQSAASKSWAAFDAALGPEKDRTADLHNLYGDSLRARGDFESAAKVYRAVLAGDPKNANAWLGLNLSLRRGGTVPLGDAELKELNALAAAIGDSVDLRLVRSNLLVDRIRKPTVAEFRKLAEGADKLDKPERRRLLAGLGDAASRGATLLDDAEAKPMRNLAIEFLLGAAELDPNDVLVRSSILDLAFLNDRKDVVGAMLDEIAKIEGGKGPMGTLAKVLLRLPEIRRIDDKAARATAIHEQRDRLLEAKKLRPAWGRLYVVLAQLDELEGLNDAALANYREAIEKGVRQDMVVRRAVELYRDRRQDDMAALLLNTLYTEMNLPEDLERFRAIKDLLSRDIPKSERPVIERIAPEGSKEWRVQLLRGALLAAIGADDDALKAFKEAVSLGDNVPETWASLVAHLVRTNRMAEAKRAADDATKVTPPKTEAARAELLIAISGCYEMVGDRAKAEEKLREAFKTAPRELNPNKQLIAFLQRTGRGDEALTLLRQLKDGAGQDLARWARRHLAMTLIGREGYNQRVQALQLIDQNIAVSPNDPEDVKARAVVLTVDPVTRMEGVKTLKEYAKWGDLTSEEFLLLGNLSFEQGLLFESVEYFEKAARPRAGLTADHIANLVRVYCMTGRLDRARSTMERLKQFAPRSWPATAAEARVLYNESLEAEKRGAADDAKSLRAKSLDAILAHPDARTEDFLRRRTGPLLEEFGFFDEAELYYRRLLTEAKEPLPHFPLASFLVRRKRGAEAIELAKKYESGTPPVLTAKLRTGAIRARSPGGAEERETAVWLEDKLAKASSRAERVGLILARAELSDAIGKYDDAINGYREAMILAKGMPAAEVQDFTPEQIANNLAMILALHRPAEADAAIKLMDEVIAIRGPSPAYLDTRAVALILKGGKSEEAARDLDLALIQQKRPAYLFHLAWAYDLNPNKQALREQTLEEAKKLGLTPEDLHPMEHIKFNQLYRTK